MRPSAGALARSRETGGAGHGVADARLLAVDEPKPTTRLAAAEFGGAKCWLRWHRCSVAAEILRHEQATQQAVLDALAGAYGWCICSCHGCDRTWAEPLQAAAW